MEYAAAAQARSRSAWHRRGIAAAAACWCAGAPWAQPVTEVAAAPAAEQALRLEINTSSVPRIDGPDSAAPAPRVDLSLLPAGGSGLGVALGLSSLPARDGLQPVGSGPRASMDVGLHMRKQVSAGQIDLTAWRRLAEADVYTLVQRQQQAVYGARVELNLKPVLKAGFTADRGFLGMQLESGARITVKRRHGGPMVYYRTAF